MLALLVLTAGFCLAPTPAQAYPKVDDGEGLPQTCSPFSELTVRLLLDGIFLDTTIVRGRLITISAEDAKIVVNNQFCNATLHPLPAGAFTWTLVSRPRFSTTTLNNTSTLRASLVPDNSIALRDNAYRVRFTACPGGCTVANVSVAETSVEIVLTAVSQLALPPGVTPVLPPETATQPSEIPDAGVKCQAGGGLVDPQWVTVDTWNGPQDYRLLQGEVQKARISRKDNPLNHDSQDFLVHVKPDPAYRNLLRGTQDIMEVEWERNHFPEGFRATAGDRVAVFGYWILDCGHDYKTEIHPPVGIAVQRARAVAIPSNLTFRFPGSDDVSPAVFEPVGTNVYVPGVVTDLFFNRDSGEITNNCSWTGLHQPARGIPPSYDEGDCIRGPSPINRLFSFKIYLPPKPAIGSSFAVPLYSEIGPHPSGFNTGPPPQIQLINPNGAVPYLQVTVDLRSFAESRYARRIYAGWVLASPDNWGLRRWKLRLNQLEVSDDADGRFRGDGDWRFWLNTNNGTPEWTKLFDCSGCVHGTETFAGRPYQTGPSAEVSPDRSLGPDHLLFPGQRIWVHSSGFEEDWIVSDDTGSVNKLVPQQPATYATPSGCTSQTESGCGSYTLHYQIMSGTLVPPATLSTGAQNLLDKYAIGPATEVTCLICRDGAKGWYPYDAQLTSRSQPVFVPDTLLFRVQPSLEVNALTDITREDFFTKLVEARTAQPEALAGTLGDLRTELDAELASERGAEARLDARLLRQGMPADLWEEYFGDVLLYQIFVPLSIKQ